MGKQMWGWTWAVPLDFALDDPPFLSAVLLVRTSGLADNEVGKVSALCT